jgi:hypothetical protein
MNKKVVKLLLLAITALGLSVCALADSGSFYNPYGQCTITWDCGDQCATGFICLDINDCNSCGPICQDCQ